MTTPPVSTDTDELHYLERELRDEIASNPEIFRFIEQGSLDGLWYWDLDDPAHEWMSDEFWRTFGVDPTSMPHLAETWQDLIDPDDLAVALDNFQKHCADPSHPYDQTVRYRHADGSTVWVRCRGMAIRDDTGRPVRMLGAHTDVTAERAALLETRRLLDVERQNDALSDFVHVTAHDLRSPLNTIAGHLGYLTANFSDDLPETARDLLAFSVDAANRMLTLLDALQPFSSSTHELVVVDVDLDQLVAGVWDDLRSEVEPTGASLHASDLGTVPADEAMLRLVVQNLVSNAIKFRTADAPKITIERHERGDDVMIVVGDNGRGIDAQTEERAFDLFYRGGSTADVDGTGTGLTLCARILRRHGGTISIDGRPEGGTAVTCTLPRSR